ncbi:hypothetical protein ACFV0L_18390 [Streptosporangium canum]|uniref:hypothetical protein n=1 Tax=Streptosporangium canum TaxID=324952 RepID=UPI003686F6B4
MKGLFTPSPERERARLEAERIRIEAEKLRDAARRQREIEEAEHLAEVERHGGIIAEEQQARATNEAEAQRERARTRRRDQRERWAERTRTAGRLAVMSITNLGVNLVAVSGQTMAFMQRGLPTLWAVLAAGIIESVAVYVSWHAHVALREGDAAWRTRMTSYGVGAGAGYLSYTHVLDYPELFAACSLASPFLWSMHSRHLHRQDLREQGLIDTRAPKFSALRWLLHTKETFAAFKWAVAEGVQSPQTSVAVVRERRAVRMTWQAVEDTKAAVIAAQRATVQLTLTHMAALTQELYGADPNAVKAKEDAERWINRVASGAVPRYIPQFVPALNAADGGGPSAADEASADGGRKPGGRLRRILFGRGRTADGGQTKAADETRTGGGRAADDKRPSGRTKRADGGSRPRGRSGAKAADGGRANGRTVRARVSGRTARTSGRSAGLDGIADLLPLGRTILAEHQQRSTRRLTRDALAAAVKADGRTISNARASALLRCLLAEGSSAAGDADGTGSSARTNKAADGGSSATGNADGTGSSTDNNNEGATS